MKFRTPEKRMAVKGKATPKGKIWVNAGLSKRSEINDAEDLGNRKIERRRQRYTGEKVEENTRERGCECDGKIGDGRWKGF